MQNNPKTRSLSALEWNEPEWSYRPRLKTELSTVLNLKMWLRVLIIVILLATLLAYAVNRRFPGLVEFNWVRGVALSCVALIVILGMQIAILWFAPPIIRITAKGISRQSSSVHWRLRSEIRSILIDVSDPACPLMSVDSSKRPFAVGIAPTVESVQLALFLRETFPEVLVEERR